MCRTAASPFLGYLSSQSPCAASPNLSHSMVYTAGRFTLMLHDFLFVLNQGETCGEDSRSQFILYHFFLLSS